MDLDQIDVIKKTTQINIDLLEMHYIAAKLIKRSWQKRSEYKENTNSKICFIGLDNVGKSTLISLLKKTPISQAVNQGPTSDVNQINYSMQNSELILWDFAGQGFLRDKYLENPERYFLQIDVLIYVFDIQDQDRSQEALEYFDRILNNMKILGENPFYLFLLHKLDPELKNNPDIEIGVNFLKEKIGERMKNLTQAKYEIVSSSIYSTFKENPEVVGYLKDVFKTEKDNPNLLLVDVMVKLTENLFTIASSILDGQQRIIDELKPPQLYKGDSGSISIQNNQEGQNFVKPSQIAKKVKEIDEANGSGGSETNIMDELKSMFEVLND